MQSIDLDSDAKVKVTDDTEVRKLRQWRISNYCLHRYAWSQNKKAVLSQRWPRDARYIIK